MNAVSFSSLRRPYQRNDDFAVRVCLEVVGRLEALAEDAVVVDFAIDGERDSLLLVDQGLRTRVDTDDTQALVDED
jgi:hypothetical protein